MSRIYETLTSTGLPCAYSHFKTQQTPPYLVYIGAGQYNFDADDTHYYGYNTYQVEYYYTTKSEETEASIEAAMLADGFRYAKSEDVYIENEDIFVIYYYI